MRLEIKQKKWSLLFDQYEIFLNDELKYKAKTKPLSWMPKITVRDLHKRSICTVGKIPRLKAFLNYKLEFEKGHTTIQSNSWTEYHILNSKGTLSFCEQKGNLIGVFLNDDQVGMITKNTRKILAGDKYSILFENDEVDELILIGFTIAYDMEYNSGSDGVMSWNFGNVAINPSRQIDPNWKPKDDQ